MHVCCTVECTHALVFVVTLCHLVPPCLSACQGLALIWVPFASVDTCTSYEVILGLGCISIIMRYICKH